MLTQKVERNLTGLSEQERKELHIFLFGQIGNEKLALSIIRRLASAEALVVSSLYLDVWPSFLEDMVAFMEKGSFQHRNGLVLLQFFP